MPQKNQLIRGNKDRALDLVKNMLGKAEIGEAGQVQWPVDFLWDRELEILSQSLNLGEMSKDYDLARNIAQDALNALADERLTTVTLQDFERTVEAEVRSRTGVPIVKWHFLAPLYVDGAWVDAHEPIEVSGLQLVLSSWDEIESWQGAQEFWNRAHAKIGDDGDAIRSMRSAAVPITITLRARTVHQAETRVEEAYQVLRAILTLVAQRGQITMQWGGSRSIAVVSQSPLLGAFAEDFTFNSLFADDPLSVSRQYKTLAVTPELGRCVEQTLIRLAELAEPIRQRVVDAVLKYGSALDAPKWEYAFLLLWQSLETLAISTESTVTTDVAKRIACLLGNEQVDRDLLPILAKRRNELVHEGRFGEEGLRQVMFLKIYVERAIAWFLILGPKLRTINQWEEYYRHVPMQGEDLRIRVEIIQQIIESRGGLGGGQNSSHIDNGVPSPSDAN